MEKKYLNEIGLADVANHVNSRLKTVTTMPVNANDGAVRLYVGDTDVNYTKGHTYQYKTAQTKWIDITPMVDISNKADKVQSATNGDLAGLDNNGNLTDSGILATNVVTKVQSATDGDLAGLNINGEMIDSGIPANKVIQKTTTATGLLRDDGTVDTSTYATTTQLADKADKVVSAVVNDFATLDSYGNLTDSGINKNIVPNNASQSNQLATVNDIPEVLSDLGDVEITNPVNKQIMAYNSTSQKWENQTGQVVIGSAVFKGSINFANLPTTGMVNGDWYDIKDAFTTDNRFEEGSGISCGAGTDVIWVSDESKWNILTPSGVYSFNGRTGAVVPASGDYDASDIDYDNTTSGLTADDVQEAIDEIESNKADKNNAYLTTDSAETTIDDADYVPFYDTSATAKRKSLWSNIKAKLKTYFDTLYATITSVGDLISLTTTDKTSLVSAVNEVVGDIEDIWENNARTGVHNLLPITLSELKAINISGTWVDNVYTISSGGSNVTYTCTVENGYVTEVDVNGTSGSNGSTFTIKSRSASNYSLPTDKYILSGNVASLSDIYQQFQATRSGNLYNFGTTQGTSEVTGDVLDTDKLQIVIRVEPDKTISHAKIKNMIRLAADTDTTFTLPAETNLQLAQDINNIWDVNARTGVHQLYDMRATSTTDQYGVTWTVNADKTISVSGTPTGFKAFETVSYKVLPIGNYRCSFNGLNLTNVMLNALALRSGNTVVRVITENRGIDFNFSITADDVYDNILMTFKRDQNNVACSGTIKPMITLADDINTDFGQYAETNYQLTQITQNKVDYGFNAKTGVHQLFPSDLFKGNYTHNDVTFTANNGIITCSGTASATAFWRVYFTIPKGSYKLYGGQNIESQSGGDVFIALYNPDGSGSYFQPSADGVYTFNADTYLGITLRFGSGIDSSNYTFKPTLYYAEDTYDGYSEFAETNLQLTQDINNIWDANAKTGVHQLLRYKLSDIKRINTDGTWSGNVYTFNGITYTFTTDNFDDVLEIDANGTATANATVVLPRTLKNILDKGDVILSGCPENGSASKYETAIWDENSSSIAIDSSHLNDRVRDFGYGVTFDLSKCCKSTGAAFNVDNLAVICIVRTGAGAVNHIKFYPLIRLAFDTDTSLTPFAETNLQLTQDKVSYDFNARTGVHQWFDFNKTEIADSLVSGGAYDDFTISATGSWKGTVFYTDVVPNTNYKIRTDVVVTSGVGYINVSPYPSGVGFANSGAITSSKIVDFTFNSGENSKIRITCFCTTGTSETGNVKYKDFLLALAEDTNNDCTPFSETNLELTQSKVDYDFNAHTGVHQLLDPQYFEPDTNAISASDVIKTDIGEVTFNGTSINNVEARLYYLCKRQNETLKLIGGVKYRISIGTVNENVGMSLGYTGADGTYTNLANVNYGMAEYEFVCPAEADGKPWSMQINCKANTVFDNYTVYPVLCFAEDTYTGKAPYAMTNRQLTEDKVSYGFNAKTGVHQLIPSSYRARGDANGITWSDNGKGVVTANGTTDTGKNSQYASYITPDYSGQVILSGCSSGDSKIHIYPYDTTTSTRPYKDSSKSERLSTSDNVYNGNEISFYMEEGHEYAIICRIYGESTSVTVDNFVFYPLLRDIEDTVASFGQHTMTNRELTDLNTLFQSEVTNIVEGASLYSDIGNKLSRYGRMAHLQLGLSGVTATSYDTVIGVIPSEYRPKDSSAFSPAKAGNDTTLVKIGTNGDIQVSSNLSNSGLVINMDWTI